MRIRSKSPLIFLLAVVASAFESDRPPTSEALAINHVAPTVTSLAASPNVVPVNTAVNALASFTDPGSADIRTGTFDWDDGGTTGATIYQEAKSALALHFYTKPGVYTVRVALNDDDKGPNNGVYQYVVVYDPAAGFVIGDGGLTSLAGVRRSNLSLQGRADFESVARYMKRATVPNGKTEVQFKGVGTLNGVDGYKFMIWETDNSELDGADTFRIRITDGSDNVVYDNGVERAIAGRSIVVHTGK